MEEQVTPQIPDGRSLKELAAFWDTHDLTDFEDQLEEVTKLIFEQNTITAKRFGSV